MRPVGRCLFGVVAFGAVTAACGGTSGAPIVGAAGRVQSVTVSPASTTILRNATIRLSASVVADAAVSRMVLWTSGDTAIATVDTLGLVSSSARNAGYVAIMATAVADKSRFAAALINVSPLVPTDFGLPVIFFASLLDTLLNPANPANAFGKINVIVNTVGGGTIDVFLSRGAPCISETIAAADLKAGTLQVPPSQSGPSTLLINTAAVSAIAPITPVYANGAYCLKGRFTSGGGTAYAPNPIVLTINNPAASASVAVR